jgi:VWFA-related protein
VGEVAFTSPSWCGCYIELVRNGRHLRTRTAAVAVWLLAVVLPAGSGRAQSSESPADTPTIHVDSQLVLLDAMVEEKKTGRTVDTLSAKDFQLSEDGTPQAITYFSRDQLPLSVVLLFDMTETVHAAMKPLAQAGLEILGHLKREDEVAVMTFSSRADLMQGFTTNRQLAAEAIKTASWMADVEGTFLDEDMYEAVEQVNKAKQGSRRVLVWLTDGTANQENAFTRASIGQHAPAHLHSQTEALQSLLQSGAVVSVLIDRTAETNRAIASAGLNGTRVGDFEQYARATGGPVLNTTSQDAPERLAMLIDLIRARYTLGYRPSRVESANKFCKLSLELSVEALREHPEVRKRDLVVVTKSGYYR